MSDKTANGFITENGRNRYLTGISIWAMAFGCVIGWGCFVMPGTTFLPDAGPVGTAAGIALAACMGLIMCANYSWLVQKHPEGGGSYAYTRMALGEDHAFLAAWSLELAYISLLWANASAFVLLARYLVGDVLQWGFHYTVAGYDVYCGEVLVTMMIETGFGLITCFGKRLANALRTVLAVVLFVSVIILFVGVAAHTGFDGMFSPAFSDREPAGIQILNIAVLAPWMYVGFEVVVHSVGEVRFSARKIFSYAAVAIITGMIVYILLALTAAADTPSGYADWSEYVSGLDRERGIMAMPVFYNSWKAMGDWGIRLVGIASFSALATSMMGFHRAAARVLKNMAAANLLSEKIAYVNDDGIPINASILVWLLSLPIPFVGRTAIGWNADVSTLSVAIVYVYISLCAWKTARGDGNKGVMASGVMGVISSAAVLFFLLVPNIFAVDALATESYLMLAVWSLAGMLYYWYVFSRDRKHRFGNSTIMWIMMLFLLFFSINVWGRLDTQEKIESVSGDAGDFVNTVLARSSLIQLAIIVVALFIMFRLFVTMLRREKELDLQIIKAEERDRAKSEFLSNMSHDIRTPMNAIVGFTDLAMLDTGNKEKMEEYLGKIKASSSHLLALINDILEMSRIESGKIELKEEPVNLPELLSDLQAIIIGQAEAKQQELMIDSRMTDANVLCDRLRLNQVMLNLISNAIKYTPSGGRIAVSFVQKTPVKDGRASYEIRVKDNGIGMSEEFASRIFEAFEREQTSTVSGIQGTGLVMAITKTLVDMMGGEIFLDTEKGRGSEFTVLLDFSVTSIAPDISSDTVTGQAESSGKGEETDSSGTDAGEAGLEGRRVLLVDDIEINRQMAMMMLQMQGIEVEEAADGTEAVRMVESSEPGYYDAVLMDIQMPVMDGYEAARSIRALDDPILSGVPVIAMTANAFAEDIKKAEDAGMNGHIAKPIDVNILVRTLKDILSGSPEDPKEDIGGNDGR